MAGLGMGGPDMGGLILYGACNGGPGIVRNVPNPAQSDGNYGKSSTRTYPKVLRNDKHF